VTNDKKASILVSLDFIGPMTDMAGLARSEGEARLVWESDTPAAGLLKRGGAHNSPSQ